MKVEQLSQYGKGLEMPRYTLKHQKRILLKILKREFGSFGMISVMIGMMKHTKKLKKQYPDMVKLAASVGKDQDKQVISTAALFLSMADKRGRVYAAGLMKSLIQQVAPITLPAIHAQYDVVKCEGDIFTNFKKFTKELFVGCDKQGTWKNDGFIDTENCLEFKVTSCINVELMQGLGCPELIRMGCDHDLGAYHLMEEGTQCSFRRSKTIANGDDYCHFFYHRKGTAPDTAHLNK